MKFIAHRRVAAGRLGRTALLFACLVAAGACASPAPLPAGALSDGESQGPAGSAPPWFDVPPLPAYGAAALVADPFTEPDEAQIRAASETGPAIDDSGDAPAPQGASPAQPSVPARDAAATSATGETGTSAPLEGPPVPLAPPLRMSGGASDQPAGASGDNGATDNRPITLNFQRAELGAVLNAFAQFTGLNIVASEQARGLVSLRLNHVPWRSAFDTLLDVNGLAMERRGNVIWVAPLAELAARERRRFEAHARAADLEPLASRLFELHYARAEDLQRLLAASGSQRVLSRRGGVMADARTNLLFVTDLPARLDQIGTLIAALDRPTRQVLIEARIVEGDAGFSRSLGARLSLKATGDGPSTGLTGGKDGTIFDLSAGPLAGFEAASAGFTLFAARATRLLSVELSALEAEGRGQIVSSPRVVTAERMKAVIEQGTELPYQAKVGLGVSGVQFRRASLRLLVEPRITPGGRVILDLDVAKDSVGEHTTAGPAIDTRHVQTRVEVEDGGTVLIGGIYTTDDRDDVTRVPVLGKIPLLGVLFRHRAHRDRRSELVVFITPSVVHAE